MTHSSSSSSKSSKSSTKHPTSTAQATAAAAPAAAAPAPEVPAPTPRPPAFKVAAYSHVGTRHGDCNQDRPFYGYTADGMLVAAVFDGHGLLGETAASACVNEMERLLATGRNSGASSSTSTSTSSSPPPPPTTPVELTRAAVYSDPHSVCTALFSQLQLAVERAHDAAPSSYSYTSGQTTLNFELDVTAGGNAEAASALGPMYVCPEMDYLPPRPVDFGCTAVVAFVGGANNAASTTESSEEVIVAAAGDASAIICRQNVPGCEDRDGFAVDVPCVKHTASEPMEQDRIERDFPGEAYFTPDGYLAPTDPLLSQYETQITRSIGHRLLRAAGITSDPEVHRVSVGRGQGHSLLLCSDGITDELAPEGILDRLVAVAGDAKDAAQGICKDAQDFCMDEDKIDDCTAVVVYWGQGEEELSTA